MSHTIFRRCALASFVALVPACAAFNGAPTPIAAEQVLVGAPGADGAAMRARRATGADQLRGFLSDE